MDHLSIINSLLKFSKQKTKLLVTKETATSDKTFGNQANQA